jgi:hypothetical protein
MRTVWDHALRRISCAGTHPDSFSCSQEPTMSWSRWLTLSPCRRITEKIIVLQLNKTLYSFHGKCEFVAVFIRIRHWYVYLARWILSTPLHTVYVRLFVILSSRVRMTSMWSLLLSFPTKTLYEFLIFHACYMSNPFHPSRFDHSDNIRRSARITKTNAQRKVNS